MAWQGHAGPSSVPIGPPGLPIFGELLVWVLVQSVRSIVAPYLNITCRVLFFDYEIDIFSS